MTTLTAEMKCQIKKADSVCLDFQDVEHLSSRGTCTLRIGKKAPKGASWDTNEDRYDRHPGFEGFIHNGHKSQAKRHSEFFARYADTPDNIHNPASGCWVLTTAHLNEHLQSVFHSIPAGSLLTFRVRLDWQTSPVAVDVSLHGDVLEVEAVTAKGKRLVFTLDVSLSRHNSARFGFGTPVQKDLLKEVV